MGTSRVLITGAGGIVGKGIRPFLAARYSELILVDRHPIETISSNETAIQGDINDPEVVKRALEGVNRVVHLAYSYALDIPFEQTLETNYRGFVRLVEAFIAGKGRNFVFASSHHGWGLYPRGKPVPVEAQPKPDGWYGVSKVFGEATLGFLAHTHGFSAVSLRIGNTSEVVADERHLHMWISHRDLARLFELGLEREKPGHVAAFAVADCAAPFFDNSSLTDLGYCPQDRPEDNVASPEVLKASPARGIFGECVGGAYAETNLKTDIAVWRIGFQASCQPVQVVHQLANRNSRDCD